MQASFRDPRIPEARSPRRTLLETVRKSDSSNAPTVDLATIRRPNGPKGSVFHMPARLRCRHLRAFSDGFSRHLGEQGYNKEKGPSIEVPARSCLIVCSERALGREHLTEGGVIN